MRHPAMTRLLALVQTNLSSPIRQYQTIQNADEATIFVYDVIDPYFGISAERFVRDLMAITAPVINLRINSPGGDVFEAQAMITAIGQHPSKVVAHIDGLAASAAAQIALAADEVEIAEGAFYMIHRSWTFAMGNSEDLISVAELLEKVDAEMVKHFMRETGQTEDQITTWVDDETWFNADEAVGYGFADRKAEPSAATSNAWNLSVYEHVPKALLKPAALTQEPSASDEWLHQFERARRLARAL